MVGQEKYDYVGMIRTGRWLWPDIVSPRISDVVQNKLSCHHVHAKLRLIPTQERINKGAMSHFYIRRENDVSVEDIETLRT
jgi:hypothetical protein